MFLERAFAFANACLLVAHSFVLVPPKNAGSARHRPRQAPLMGLAQWQSGELGCLPFPMQDAFLIGDTKRLHLYEARFLSLLEKALNDGGCVAAVTVVDGALLGVAAICDVVRWTRREVGVSVTLRCIGRVKIEAVKRAEPYVLAGVSLVNDKREPGSADARAALTVEAVTLHRDCVELERKLKGKGSPAKPVQAAARMNDEVVWGHEQLQVRAFEKSLPEMARDRKAVLLFDSDRTKPAAAAAAAANRQSEGAQKWLLGCANAEEEESQLMSFAAMSCFEGEDRVKALLLTDTAMRLSLAVELLRTRRKLLVAKRALSELCFDGNSSEQA